MTELMIFIGGEFGELRAVVTDDTPEVIASDVARILGYPEANKLTCLLDDDEKGRQKVATLDGMQTMTTLNEAGFYRAVMLHRASCIKDAATRERVKRFQHWVTQDVFPAIRRNSGYVDAFDGCILVDSLAKIMRQNGLNIGQNRLFERLRSDGYLCSFSRSCNIPTQHAMDMGLFRIKETVIVHADGSTTNKETLLVTDKGRAYFVERYCAGMIVDD